MATRSIALTAESPTAPLPANQQPLQNGPALWRAGPPNTTTNPPTLASSARTRLLSCELPASSATSLATAWSLSCTGLRCNRPSAPSPPESWVFFAPLPPALASRELEEPFPFPAGGASPPPLCRKAWAPGGRDRERRIGDGAGPPRSLLAWKHPSVYLVVLV